MATPWFGINRDANRAINEEVARTLDEQDLVRACRSLRVQTLILDGEEDPRPRWAVDSLANALPVVRRVTLDGVGHVPWLDAPSRTQAELAQFLAG
jgi:proline iminopeptidase